MISECVRGKIGLRRGNREGDDRKHTRVLTHDTHHIHHSGVEGAMSGLRRKVFGFEIAWRTGL